MTINDQISIQWHIDDVVHIRPDLNQDQARAVLLNVKDNHDATIGVNWEVLEIVAEHLFPAMPTQNLFNESGK